MYWSYKSKIGTFIIKPNQEGKFLLLMNDDLHGSYLSPDAAADDVYCCATGCSEWDDLDEVEEPCDLSEWDFHK